MSKYFKINGYWKDDEIEFNSYIVKEYDDVEVNEELNELIFYYGLSENDINHSIYTGGNDQLEFVITSYIEITLDNLYYIW